jgi:hypothetical protein
VEVGWIEMNWTYGQVPLARMKSIKFEMMGKEPRGRVLDVPTGTGF